MKADKEKGMQKENDANNDAFCLIEGKAGIKVG
jgi:hypothetical protein